MPYSEILFLSQEFYTVKPQRNSIMQKDLVLMWFLFCFFLSIFMSNLISVFLRGGKNKEAKQRNCWWLSDNHWQNNNLKTGVNLFNYRQGMTYSYWNSFTCSLLLTWNHFKWPMEYWCVFIRRMLSSWKIYEKFSSYSIYYNITRFKKLFALLRHK